MRRALVDASHRCSYLQPETRLSSYGLLTAGPSLTNEPRREAATSPPPSSHRVLTIGVSLLSGPHIKLVCTWKHSKHQ